MIDNNRGGAGLTLNRDVTATQALTQNLAYRNVNLVGNRNNRVGRNIIKDIIKSRAFPNQLQNVQNQNQTVFQNQTVKVVSAEARETREIRESPPPERPQEQPRETQNNRTQKVDIFV